LKKNLLSNFFFEKKFCSPIFLVKFVTAQNFS